MTIGRGHCLKITAFKARLAATAGVSSLLPRVPRKTDERDRGIARDDGVAAWLSQTNDNGTEHLPAINHGTAHGRRTAAISANTAVHCLARTPPSTALTSTPSQPSRPIQCPACLTPNSSTLSGRRQVRGWSQTC